MVVDYSKGKIYKLVNDTSDDIYIGSTCQSLAKRKGGHYADYQKFLDGKKVSIITSFKLFENDGNVSIILIEEFPCNNRMELLKKEREYIETMKCLNKIIPTRTNKEWRKDNKNKLLDKAKEYRENNKSEIKEWQKKYYENNIDKFKEKNKEYREDNKDKLLDKKKEYYETNKDNILERRKKYYETNKNKLKKKINCPTCNKEMLKSSLTIHIKNQH